jgi:hypothetical protein
MGTETHISLSIRIYIHINMHHPILPEQAPMVQLLPSPRYMVYQGNREETIGPTRSLPPSARVHPDDRRRGKGL